MEQTSTTSGQSARDIRSRVLEDYTRVATDGGSPDDAVCCDPGCCETAPRDNQAVSRALGYSAQDLGEAPTGSNLGLGCGNPQAIASLRPGEHVLDLGSGAGLDAFLAARQVGESGRVIGVDMTASMLQKARANQERTHLGQVEFRLGEIEALPLGDASIDVVISNCVINLSPEKQRVFQEAYRVLRPGGRVAVSDIVLTAPLPDDVRADLSNHSACVTGAASVQELEALLTGAGFVDVRIDPKGESREYIQHWVPGSDASQYVTSASITASKPAAINGPCC